MNKEFEKLPEVAKRLDGIYWSAELNIYQTEYPILFNAVGFVNGAWYAYQEQQKKIDSVLHYLSCAINPLDVEVIDIEKLLK